MLLWQALVLGVRLLVSPVGLRKHNPEVTIICADPIGSALAPAESDNSNAGYKVEGIGYDFIPMF